MSIVSIVRVQKEQIEETVRHAVQLAGGLNIRPGATVLLKPNVVARATLPMRG